VNRDKNPSATEDPTPTDRTITKTAPNKRVRDAKTLTGNHSRTENQTLTNRVGTKITNAMKLRGAITTESQTLIRRIITESQITKIETMGTKGAGTSVKTLLLSMMQ